MVRIGGGIAIIQGSAGKRLPGQQITAAELIRGVIKFIGFCIIAILCYSPFGTRWINNPSSSTIDGWDTNRTSASWGTDEWNWDVVDCIYFASAFALGSVAGLLKCSHACAHPPARYLTRSLPADHTRRSFAQW